MSGISSGRSAPAVEVAEARGCASSPPVRSTGVRQSRAGRGRRRAPGARSSRSSPARAFSSRSTSSSGAPPGGSSGVGVPAPDRLAAVPRVLRARAVRVKYTYAAAPDRRAHVGLDDPAADLLEQRGARLVPRCASTASVYAFSASRCARTAGSSRSRSQYQSSTRRSAPWRSSVGRRGRARCVRQPSHPGGSLARHRFRSGNAGVGATLARDAADRDAGDGPRRGPRRDPVERRRARAGDRAGRHDAARCSCSPG